MDLIERVRLATVADASAISSLIFGEVSLMTCGPRGGT
jgi:hypothetical protein